MLRETESSSLEECSDRIGMSWDLDQWVLKEEVYDDISVFVDIMGMSGDCRTSSCITKEFIKKGDNQGKKCHTKSMTYRKSGKNQRSNHITCSGYLYFIVKNLSS